GLSDGSRKLLTRGGFFNPSLDGGLPLFELFNPSRGSSSAICAFKAAISAACVAISAISSFRDGSAGEAGFIESLNRTPTPMSRKIYGPDFAKPPTQPGQRQLILHGSYAAATSRVQRNSVPSTHMRCMITANRRARATIAFFIPRRLAICIAQALSHDHFFERSML